MCSCTQTSQSHAREMLIFHRHKARRCNFPPLRRKSRPKTHMKNVCLVVYIVYGAIYQRARENLFFSRCTISACMCVSRLCTGDSLNGLPAHNLPMHIIVRVLFSLFSFSLGAHHFMCYFYAPKQTMYAGRYCRSMPIFGHLSCVCVCNVWCCRL